MYPIQYHILGHDKEKEVNNYSSVLIYLLTLTDNSCRLPPTCHVWLQQRLHAPLRFRWSYISLYEINKSVRDSNQIKKISEHIIYYHI